MRTQTNFRAVIADAENFSEALTILTHHGLSRGRAILVARKSHPKLFNRFMADRWAGRITEKRGGGSIMQHFRIVGG